MIGYPVAGADPGPIGPGGGDFNFGPCVGDRPAQVVYAGMTGSGLCQFNIVIPDGVSGEVMLRAEVDGAASPDGVKIAVEE